MDGAVVPVARRSFDLETAFTFTISNKKSGSDRLSKVYLMLAAQNTWQGISFGNWPYSKNPPIAIGNLKEDMFDITSIKLEENVWKYQTGWNTISECLEAENELNCASIFDPFTAEIRYLPIF